MDYFGSISPLTVYFCIFCPLPCPKSFLHRCWRRLIFIDAANKFNIFPKNWNISRNIRCFTMNIIIARQNFSAHLIYLAFSKFSYRQIIFWRRNLSRNMHKITSFLLKNRKNCPALGALPPDQWCGTYFWTGGQNRKRQIDGIFIEFGRVFAPEISFLWKKRSSPDLDRFFVPEVSVL